MLIMLFLILALKLISSIYAFKNKMPIIGWFLVSNLVFDVLSQLFQYLYKPYPRPLTGVGFLFFAISCFCYLANAACLLLFSGKTAENKTIQQTAPLATASILALILFSYPVFIGLSLVTIFFTFFIIAAIVSLIAIAMTMVKQPTLSKAVMLMLNLGCLMEVLVVMLFGFQYYWLVNICNLVFYFVILGVCSLVPKYKNLLKP